MLRRSEGVDSPLRHSIRLGRVVESGPTTDLTKTIEDGNAASPSSHTQHLNVHQLEFLSHFTKTFYYVSLLLNPYHHELTTTHYTHSCCSYYYHAPLNTARI